MRHVAPIQVPYIQQPNQEETPFKPPDPYRRESLVDLTDTWVVQPLEAHILQVRADGITETYTPPTEEWFQPPAPLFKDKLTENSFLTRYIPKQTHIDLLI